MPEEPQTVDDLRAIADDVKGQGKIPFAFGDQEQWPAGHMFSIGVSNVLGREGLDDILYGDGRWDTPEVVEAIELMFRDFVESGYYPEGVNAMTYDDANALFFSGEAAMLPTGTWLVSDDRRDGPGLRGRLLPFPAIDGSGISPPAGVGAACSCPQNAKNPEGAIDVHRLTCCRRTPPACRWRRSTPIPAHPVDTEGLEVPELFKPVLDDLSEATEAGPSATTSTS